MPWDTPASRPADRDYSLAFSVNREPARHLGRFRPATNGRTYPQTPDAVAVDGDGDTDRGLDRLRSTLKHDRAYIRLVRRRRVAPDRR